MKKLALALVFLLPTLVTADEKIVPIKVEKKDGKIDKLQIAVATYTKGDCTLDVIGTVHIADPSYYRMLNKRFTEYDKLLYELVGESNQRPNIEDRKESVMRNLVKTFLNLEQQLCVIDYNKDNFLHADMEPKELMAEMKKKGDTPITLALSMLVDMLRKYNKQENGEDLTSPAQMPALLGNPNVANDIKTMMAKQFTEEDPSKQLGGAVAYYLIDARNAKAVKVVNDSATKYKKLGLYYGAAHLPDFHTRLQKSGWKHTGTKYDTAWSDLSRKVTKEEFLFRLLQQLQEK